MVLEIVLPEVVLVPSGFLRNGTMDGNKWFPSASGSRRPLPNIGDPDQDSGYINTRTFRDSNLRAVQLYNLAD